MRRTIALMVLAAALAAACGRGGTAPDDAGPALAPTAFAEISARPAGLALPNPELTPGDVLPVGPAEICVKGYSSKVRNVSKKTKDAVYATYGITSHPTGAYEVDHLIPLELGGSNDIKNLWPEPANPRPGFHEKDRLENVLHDLVCGGQVDLATAQHAIAADWFEAWVTYR